MRPKEIVEIIEKIIDNNEFCSPIKFSARTINALYIAVKAVKTNMIPMAPEVIGGGNIKCRECGTVLGLPSLSKKYCKNCGKKLM